jgi:hypothetical protein
VLRFISLSLPRHREINHGSVSRRRALLLALLPAVQIAQELHLKSKNTELIPLT